MLPATVHAALVILFAWLVHLIFAYLGLDLGDATITKIAELIVAYILSLGGLAVFNGVRFKSFTTARDEYHPPFA